MQPQILQKPQLKFVGMEAPFISALSKDANNFKVIPPLWEAFGPRHREVPDRTDHAMYGLVYGRPTDQRSHPDELRYLAAVAVNSIGAIPPGMVSHTIPPATYAVFLHKGPIQKLGETCHHIYREWLPKSGYVQAPLPDVEVYDHRFYGNKDESVMEYWVAVM